MFIAILAFTNNNLPFLGCFSGMISLTLSAQQNWPNLATFVFGHFLTFMLESHQLQLYWLS
jgi:hypothetical protein